MASGGWCDVNRQPRAALRSRLAADPNADKSSLLTDTDKRLAIGRDVWRLRWRGQLACAVAEDASLPTTLGALLDVLTLLEDDKATLVPANRDQVHVLVDRPLPAPEAGDEVAQALRSLRDAVRGVHAVIWYRGEVSSWVQDEAPAPTWRDNDQVRQWVRELLLPRLTAQPAGLALALVKAVDDPSLHLYPSEIKHGKPAKWALRLDGLQIGTVEASSGTLTIGGAAAAGDGPQRKVFKHFVRSDTLAFGLKPSANEADLDEAVRVIRRLMDHWRGTEVAGAPVTHRYSQGIGIVDEHALEARLLKGLIRLPGYGRLGLVRRDERVARGSQFPTLWSREGPARYLDAMLTDGTTPLAIELKVATGGQGRYYRRALTQAVLYRHFIQNAPDLDPWFRAADLDRRATRPLLGIPIPTRWTRTFQANLDLLRRVATRVGADVAVLDDRKTPDWSIHKLGSEPTRESTERLSWRLAAALVHRWPKSLGRAVELHRGGGQYDEIQLQPRSDRRLDPPSPQPRISLNRPGSLWVWSALGADRWVWRGIWHYLTAGGNPAHAARLIGVTAGLRQEPPSKSPSFCELAAAFLEEVADPDAWTWRCAWSTGDYGEGAALGLERFHRVLSRYSRMAAGHAVPTIARIWCAVRGGQAEVAMDQQNLRVWASTPHGITEAPQGDALDRMIFAARLVGDYSNHAGGNVRQTGMTGAAAVEDLKAMFASAHLPTPPIPERFVSTLAFQHGWLWTTRPMKSMDMYMFDRYPDEVLTQNSEGYDVADYLAISHAGHGVNSYLLTYQVVTRRLAVFIQVGWGGAYMDEDASRRDVALACDGIGSLLRAAVPLLDAGAALGPRLIVLASRARGIGAAGWLAHRLPDRQARNTWMDEHACEPSTATRHACELLDEIA
jgi:hypothetical protein